MQKIEPQAISVFRKATRMASAVEACNGFLGKNIPKHGHFFKFVKMLQKEELSKARDFQSLANSGGAVGASKRKRKCIDKARTIANASEELLTGSITATAFIKRMVFPKNNTITEMEPDEDLFEDISYLEEEDEDEEISRENKPSSDEFTQFNCVIGLIRNSNILMLPCKHLKLCSECTIKLQAESITNGEDKYSYKFAVSMLTPCKFLCKYKIKIC